MGNSDRFCWISKRVNCAAYRLKKFRFVEPAIIALCMGLESPVCQLRTLE